MSVQINRCDVVVYNGSFYFFQTNGSTCYLYTYKEDVGIVTRKTLYVARRSVRLPTDKEKLMAKEWELSHLENPVRPVKVLLTPMRYPSSDESEDEEGSSSLSISSEGDLPEDRI